MRKQLKNPEKVLDKRINEGIRRRFGSDAGKDVMYILQREFDFIRRNGYIEAFIIASDLARYAKENHIPIGFRGSLGNSLSAYLLRITETDPLKYDLPTAVFFNDYDRNREYVMDINVPVIFQNKFMTLAEELYDNVSSEKRRDRPARIIVRIDNTKKTRFEMNICGSVVYTMLYDLGAVCNINFDSIPLDDEELYRQLYEFDKEHDEEFGCICGINGFASELQLEILQTVKPHCLDELARCYLLGHGTDVWENNGKVLLQNKTAGLKDIITSRDDIFLYLVSLGMDEWSARDIMSEVRRGHPAKNRCVQWKQYCESMRKASVPEWYIDSCEKISYLFPRAQAIAYSIATVRLSYYRLNYPDQYKKICKSLTEE